MIMDRIAYQCTLLTDIVLTSNPATEGFHRSLNYIPGSKFLGITAKAYDMQQSARTLVLFHQGKVRFGDAHPMLGEERLNKIPLAWLFDKGQSRKSPRPIHLSYDKDKAKSANEQERSAYFTSKYEWYEVNEDFSMKSAYDTERYRAKDQQMYGYFALPRGSQWQFYIDYDTKDDKAIVEEQLLGNQRLGRSKSAEYGRVYIESLQAVELDSTNIVASEEQTTTIYLYAASNWCFYDVFGQCTLQPHAQQLGLPEKSSIDWSKSQVRTRFYPTWNQHRKNRDADRLIIEKGSVIAAKLEQPLDTANLLAGIGAHRGEGFGQVLVNPNFLPTSTVNWQQTLKKYEAKTVASAQTLHFLHKASTADNESVMNFLAYRDRQNKTVLSLDEKVNQFIDLHYNKYQDLSNSQWGQVRKYARLAGQEIGILEELLFGSPKNDAQQKEDKGFLLSGQAAKEWRKNGRADHLKKILFPTQETSEQPDLSKENILLFTQKLATEMAKRGETIRQ